MKAKIRKGDNVKLISGKLEYKGTEGEVIKVIPEEEKVVVQGINIHTKHQKQVQQAQNQRNYNPGKLAFEAPISIANVMLVCPKCKKATRVALHREAGKTVRVCKQCDALIDA